jgi:hypothetical protein
MSIFEANDVVAHIPSRAGKEAITWQTVTRASASSWCPRIPGSSCTTSNVASSDSLGWPPAMDLWYTVPISYLLIFEVAEPPRPTARALKQRQVRPLGNTAFFLGN